MHWVSEQIDNIIGNVWIIGVITATISTVLDSFATCVTMVSLHDLTPADSFYAVNGAYWKVLSFSTAVGGSILGIGSISGVVMMQRQGIPLSRYIKHITPLTLLSGIIALTVLCIQLSL